MCSDDYRIGDVMPFYNPDNSKFYTFYLKDTWNDGINERHPWYAAKTSDFCSYKELKQAVLTCSNEGCEQDFALGTGCIVNKGGTYYAFYTGHNPNYPSECVTRKEGIMMAGTKSINQPFSKENSFPAIYPPTGLSYDKQSNWRDPFVYHNPDDSKYYMVLSARKDVNGTWKGVIPYFSSSDLFNWTY